MVKVTKTGRRNPLILTKALPSTFTDMRGVENMEEGMQ